jgi:GNAT superfamily N-acetyltransferase
MPNARLAEASDLTSLLELYQLSEVSCGVKDKMRAEQIWSEMLSHEGVTVFVSTEDAKIVGGQQHGFLENVVAHPEFQSRGHGRAVVHAALAAAWAKGCYHVLLQSGRKDPRVHRFYERRGFEAGLRIAYVAHRPSWPLLRALLFIAQGPTQPK